MLPDRKRLLEKLARNARLGKQVAEQYGDFLRILFEPSDWFVTLTFRDRYQDARPDLGQRIQECKELYNDEYKKFVKRGNNGITKLPPDRRIETWEPDSKNRRDPGPPVRDAALREIEHWLLELAWEAAGHTRQEIFDRLADGLSGYERRDLGRRLCRMCLICAVLSNPATSSFYFDLRSIATTSIGWVIAEEFGRAGGRWHVHLLVKGVRHLRRKKWWKRAFVRCGRNRIEAIHG